jgi:hypothetical protein
MRVVILVGLLGLVCVVAAQRVPPPALYQASYEGTWTYADGSTFNASGVTAYDRAYSRSYFSSHVPSGVSSYPSTFAFFSAVSFL